MGIGAILFKGAKYAKRALNLAPEFILGTSAETIGKAAKATKGSIFQKAKAGAKAFEAEVAAKKAAEGGFLKRLWHNTTHLFSDLYKDTKAARYSAMRKAVSNKSAIARLASKSKIGEKAVAKAFVAKSTAKGFGKAFMKKMPFIGQVLTILLEVPNIYRAARDEGIGTALKETAWAAGELGGFAAGAAIGSVICPGVGTIVGGLIGSFGVSMLRGENYSDKKDRLKEEYKLTDEQISQAQKEGYTVDDILKELEGSEEESEQQSSSESGNTNTPTQSSNTPAQGQTTQQQETVQSTPTSSTSNPFTPVPYSPMSYSPTSNLGFGTLGMYNGTLNTGFGGYGMYNPMSMYGTMPQMGTLSFGGYPNLSEYYNNTGVKFRYLG